METNSELWASVVGYDGLYEVSVGGEIRSVERLVSMNRQEDGRALPVHARVLRLHLEAGRWTVRLSAGGRERKRGVGEVVCEAFAGPRPQGAELMYRDGDRGNVRADNVAWASHRDLFASPPDEEWRDAPGYDGRYLVSSAGRVATINDPRGRPSTLLAASVDPATGYRYVGVYANRRMKRVAVHRLVCAAFHGPPPHGAQARHLDGSRTENRASNLAWGTAADNAADRDAHGRTRRGERHGNAKLTSTQVVQLRARARAGASKRALAEEAGVDVSVIKGIAAGKAWRHV